MDFIENHTNWPFVKNICEKIKDKGFQVYLIGGSVRDGLLKRAFKDFDLATDASFQELSFLFPDSHKVGESFGVVKIRSEICEVDIATFRKDGIYSDGRHPDSITPATYKQDALRRDFTINALFYDPFSKQVIDLVEGLKDLKLKTIKTVGKPLKRFKEDQLRALRTIRFVTQLNFFIEETTYRALYKVSLSQISKERILEEFQKILLSPFFLRGLEDLKNLGYFKDIFPYLSHHLSSSKNWLSLKKTLSQVKTKDTGLLLALLFLKMKLSLEQTKKDLQSLKCSKSLQHKVLFLLKSYEEFKDLNQYEKLQILNHKQGLLFLELLELMDFEFLEQFVQQYQSLMTDKGFLPTCFLTGEDLKNQGIPQGPQYKEILKECLFLQWKGELRNYKEALLWLRKKS